MGYRDMWSDWNLYVLAWAQVTNFQYTSSNHQIQNVQNLSSLKLCTLTSEQNGFLEFYRLYKRDSPLSTGLYGPRMIVPHKWTKIWEPGFPLPTITVLISAKPLFCSDAVMWPSPTMARLVEFRVLDLSTSLQSDQSPYVVRSSQITQFYVFNHWCIRYRVCTQVANPHYKSLGRPLMSNHCL